MSLFRIQHLTTKQKFDARANRDVTFHEHIFSFASNYVLPAPDPGPSNSLEYTNSDEDISPLHCLRPLSHLLATDDPPQSSSPISTSNPIYVPPPSRSLLLTHKPTWQQDYVCNCNTNFAPTCLSSNYTSAHTLFVALLSSVQELRKYVEASKSAEWVDAMTEELTALDRNETWELMALPPRKKATVADGAFLHGHLDEEVFMTPPEGYSAVVPGQAKYLNDILKDTNLLDAKATSTPLPPGIKLNANSGSLLPNPGAYRRLVGRLLYLSFTSNTLQPSVYSDASWASCPDSRCSITGFCIFLGSTLVSSKTKKQPTVSRSSVEAEYRSMGAVVCELLWLSYLLRDTFPSLPLFCFGVTTGPPSTSLQI
ncbi:putative mitochondrial protein [Sesamum angolense]|uniref:Mitochondrial protein n=1 Tax=Sesamum angolense TaxID=2727404 RepID=A0AAE1WIJ4_9LAMI|nr:putative mitochondrial protein [Sesamum angolense]